MYKISLPININPPLKTYATKLHPLSIIFSKNDDARYKWLLNYYYTFAPDNYLRFINDWWFCNDNVFIMGNCICLPVRAIDVNAIYKIIQNMMRQGFYCMGYFNNMIKPAYNDNKPDNITHDFLLYEFDSCTESFGSLSYLGNAKIKQVIIDLKALSVVRQTNLQAF